MKKLCKSTDWFLHDRDLRHERVKALSLFVVYVPTPQSIVQIKQFLQLVSIFCWNSQQKRKKILAETKGKQLNVN